MATVEEFMVHPYLFLMKLFYPSAGQSLKWTSYTLLLSLLPMSTVLAQSPTIISAVPATNAVAVPRSGAVTVTFSHPLTTASAAALKVFSSQRGGVRTRNRPAVLSNNAISFTPANYDFRPGEKVSYTVSRQAASSGGALVSGRVGQFTTAVSGAGRGSFVPGISTNSGSIGDVTVGDVDGDGDLDLLLTNSAGNFVTLMLNGNDATGSNVGAFGNFRTIPVGNYPIGVVLADVDGDGDLDLLTANANSNSVSVCLNGGNATGSNTGIFGSPQAVAVGINPRFMAVGDVDGDGDLDVLTTNLYDNTVSVRLNGGDATGSGTGIFSNGSTIVVGNSPSHPALADIDNDGDLDLVVTNTGNDRISILLNGGDATGSNTGTFSNGQTMTGVGYPNGLALDDLDGDGDADMIVGGSASSYFLVYRNGGDATGSATGVFSNLQLVAVPTPTGAVALGDVDADGDLDAVVASSTRTSVTIALNGGDATGSNTGVFGGLQFFAVSGTPSGIALGDVDSDGDLDAVTVQYSSSVTSVSFNGGSGPLATGAGTIVGAMLQAYPNPARSVFTVTGTEPLAIVTVLDAVGRSVVVARANAAGNATLNLPAGLAPGFYLVRAGAQVQQLEVE